MILILMKGSKCLTVFDAWYEMIDCVRLPGTESIDVFKIVSDSYVLHLCFLQLESSRVTIVDIV